MITTAAMNIDAELFEHVARLPIDTRFELGDEITDVQQAFLDRNGFLIFDQVVAKNEVARINAEVDGIVEQWVAEGRKEVFGVPIFEGKGLDGKPMLQRVPFTSCFSEYIHDFVRDPRFEPIRTLVDEGARVGDKEKDGFVCNTYINVPGSVYPRLGWHTDGLRDIAYLRMPKQMLNVGLHLTDCPPENGGLRLIPGTHHQGFFKMCFYKPYFVSHKPDKNEIAVDTRAGDLTVHDGRLWHRVQQSPHTGAASIRRSMYVPYLTDDVHQKGENSKTPIYHHLGALGRKVKLMRHRK